MCYFLSQAGRYFHAGHLPEIFSGRVFGKRQSNDNSLEKEGEIMTMKSSDFLKGVLIGGLIGAAAGILFAPKSGKETREDIARRPTNSSRRPGKNMKSPWKKARRLTKRRSESEGNPVDGPGKGGRCRGNRNRPDGKRKETLLDSRTRLKKALDAGIDAFKEEKDRTDA